MIDHSACYHLFPPPTPTLYLPLPSKYSPHALSPSLSIITHFWLTALLSTSLPCSLLYKWFLTDCFSLTLVSLWSLMSVGWETCPSAYLTSTWQPSPFRGRRTRDLFDVCLLTQVSQTNTCCMLIYSVFLYLNKNVDICLTYIIIVNIIAHEYCESSFPND